MTRPLGGAIWRRIVPILLVAGVLIPSLAVSAESYGAYWRRQIERVDCAGSATRIVTAVGSTRSAPSTFAASLDGAPVSDGWPVVVGFEEGAEVTSVVGDLPAGSQHRWVVTQDGEPIIDIVFSAPDCAAAPHDPTFTCSATPLRVGRLAPVLTANPSGGRCGSDQQLLAYGLTGAPYSFAVADKTGARAEAVVAYLDLRDWKGDFGIIIRGAKATAWAYNSAICPAIDGGAGAQTSVTNVWVDRTEYEGVVGRRVIPIPGGRLILNDIRQTYEGVVATAVRLDFPGTAADVAVAEARAATSC